MVLSVAKRRGEWSGEADGEAGGGALDAVDFLDGFGDGVAEGVEVVGFDLGDDVEGAGDGIDGDEACAGVVELLDGGADGFGLADFGFDEDVAADGHVVPSG